MTPGRDGSDRPLRRAAFLDRDGVLNGAVIVEGRPIPPRGVDAVRLLDGVEASCASLREAGWLLIVVTNQPDVARGTATMAEVAAINDMLAARLGLDAVLVCPHDDADACSCRKPAPGLLQEAAHRFGISLENSVMVGDRWRDIEAGRRAGCRTVFIDAGYAEPAPAAPELTVASLHDALPWILQTTSEVETRWRSA